MGLDTKVVTYVKNKPLLIVSLVGKKPELKSILLNGHYDVVPVEKNKWNNAPFDAIESDGKIYARGTQDMKCVCMQYLEALSRLKNTKKITLDRSIHISFVPDEEIGGLDGVGKFIKDSVFTDLNVGVALDEGLASEGDTYTVFYGT